jgi:hypothetical protein
LEENLSFRLGPGAFVCDGRWWSEANILTERG